MEVFACFIALFGIFMDHHEVGQFVYDGLGHTKSVNVTRGGMVITECASKRQMDKAFCIHVFTDNNHVKCVKCFTLDGSKRSVGVIKSIPLFEEDNVLCFKGERS